MRYATGVVRSELMVSQDRRKKYADFDIKRLLALSARIIRRLSTAERMMTPSSSHECRVRSVYLRRYLLRANTTARVPPASH